MIQDDKSRKETRGNAQISGAGWRNMTGMFSNTQNPDKIARLERAHGLVSGSASPHVHISASFSETY